MQKKIMFTISNLYRNAFLNSLLYYGDRLTMTTDGPKKQPIVVAGAEKDGDETTWKMVGEKLSWWKSQKFLVCESLDKPLSVWG